MGLSRFVMGLLYILYAVDLNVDGSILLMRILKEKGLGVCGMHSWQ
jgi:hypothetical protein